MPAPFPTNHFTMLPTYVLSTTAVNRAKHFCPHPSCRWPEVIFMSKWRRLAECSEPSYENSSSLRCQGASGQDLTVCSFSGADYQNGSLLSNRLGNSMRGQTPTHPAHRILASAGRVRSAKPFAATKPCEDLTIA